MKVQVQHLLERAAFGEELNIDAEMPIPERADDDEVFPEPVRVKARVTPTGPGVLVKGRVSGVVEQTCARCLCDYRLLLDIDLLIEYRLDESGPSPEEDEEWFPIEDETIDLLDPVRQHLLVALPMKPLCDEDCPGLGEGDEVTENGDPRMQALAELREKIKEQEKGG